MIDIDDIVEQQIVAKIDNEIVVKTASSIVNGEQTISFCDQKYLRLFNKVHSASNTYKILSFSGENVVIENDGSLPAISERQVMKIDTPHYFRGTPRAVNSEYQMFSDDERDKLPMIWLLNPVRETFYRLSPMERRSELRLFLLCSADFENDLTKDFRAKNITPLMALAESFFNAINSNISVFANANEYSTRDFSIFGTENESGIIKYIIDSDLSGVEMRVTVDVRSGHCNC